MLATDAAEPFDSPDHVFELLWGGVRALACIADGHCRLVASNGRDLTPYFPELHAIPDHVHAREAILDGELVALDAEGHPDFDLLRPRLFEMAAATAAAAGTAPPDSPASLPLEFRIKRVAGTVAFFPFDALWLDGRSLEDRPLWQRRNRLHAAVAAGPEIAPVDFVDAEGIAFFDAVIDRRLEGMVAKEKLSTYARGRRSPSWLQVRALYSGDFVIGGYAIGGSATASRRGEPFSQLLLGAWDHGRFEFVGSVSGGLTAREARALVSLLEPLHIAESPFFDTPPLPRLLYWTQPQLACHVRFSEWSPDGHLRFPIFSALRPDLAAEDCTLA